MPLGKGVRYRWGKDKAGRKVRFAWQDGDLVEVKYPHKKAKKVHKRRRK